MPPEWLNNLGNVLLKSGAAHDAVVAYRESLEGAPNAAPTWTNLAKLLSRLGRLDEATGAARHAVQAAPFDAEARYALARAVIQDCDIQARRLRAHSKAVTLAPCARATRPCTACAGAARPARGGRRVVPRVARRGTRQPLCIAPAGRLRRWLATRARKRPLRANRVRQLRGPLRREADSLDYRAPALLTQAAGGQLAAPSATLDVADLGCGTGLCGPWLKPWARHLAGCDLSTGILQQAQRRRSYDALFKAELVHCLRCQPGRFDLLVCADTHCYFGDLQDSADAAVAALRPGGSLFYTVEAALDGGGLPFHLRPSGRYVHAHYYVLDGVAGVGQRTLGMEGHALRQQAGVRERAGFSALKR